jgi:protein-tyrosine phosphatase
LDSKPLKIIKVSDRLYRGSHPTGKMDQLKAKGITHILTFQSGMKDWIGGDGMYTIAREARDAGLDHEYFPQGFIRAPSRKETYEVLNYLAVLHNGEPESVVFVHCTEGVDRTGWMIAAYRVLRDGWTVDRAVEEWKVLGHHRYRYFWWEGSFRRMMANSGATDVV